MRVAVMSTGQRLRRRRTAGCTRCRYPSVSLC